MPSLVEGFLGGVGKCHSVRVRNGCLDQVSALHNLSNPLFWSSGIRKDFKFIMRVITANVPRLLQDGARGRGQTLWASVGWSGRCAAFCPQNLVGALTLPWGSALPSYVPLTGKHSPLNLVPFISTSLPKLKLITGSLCY